MNRHIYDGLFSLNCVPKNATVFTHICSENLGTLPPYRFFFLNTGYIFSGFVKRNYFPVHIDSKNAIGDTV
jgi:hypothetical protein